LAQHPARYPEIKVVSVVRSAGTRSSRPAIRAWRAVLGIALAVTVAGLPVAGCGRVIDGRAAAQASEGGDRSLIIEYFRRSNEAASQGPAAQADFLARTQHPDVESHCDLGALTVWLEPSLGTVRPDDGWQPEGATRALRGRVYLVAVAVTVRRDHVTLGTQIGAMHVTVLDGTAYGIAPCPG
jgi:hypothetical protein